MSRRGFTLVEMLVVMGIIAVLIGLLLPAVMMAVNRARRAAISQEIAELAKSIEAYKEKTQDYPPNFRDYGAFIRHVRKVYPSIDAAHLDQVIKAVWGNAYSVAFPPIPPNVAVTPVPYIDEGESLVFWLYLVDNDKRQPFKALVIGCGRDPVLLATATMADVLNKTQSAERLFPFKEERLIDGPDTSDSIDVMPSYKALYSGETAYLYIDSRSYWPLTNDYTTITRAAYAEDPTAGYARPYWSQDRTSSAAVPPPPADQRPFYKPVNPTTFQILCAGQDGEFGLDPSPISLKYFKGGGGYDLSGADNDNLTNFSEGKRLQDYIE